ncbi:HNH endonuclease signature motif containing protein [Antribacter gilvus]|uniref:HNH endonuclease signature motif containing protein n=1 Tax=Antribacter gilvus TaxID=2304675 RepID=UPI000F780397|nr:HNH endonuclease signature motif containing protein [Antribacter gilvus]
MTVGAIDADRSVPAMTAVPVASMPVASMPVASMPVASMPVASMPVASMPVVSMPVVPVPVASVPVVRGGVVPVARSLEVVLADLEAVAGELVSVAGPGALDVLDVAGGLVVSRLVGAGARLRAVTGRLDALRLSFLPRIEADGRWGIGPGAGARSFATWLAMVQNISPATARREVRVARVLDQDLPATQAAALAGTIGPDHLTILVNGAPTSPARKTALTTPVPGPDSAPDPDPGDQGTGDEGAGDGGAADGGAVAGGGPVTGEVFLLAQAAAHRPDRFRRLVARFAAVSDPDADERGYTHTKDREHLEVSKTFGGYHLTGFLTDEHGLTLTTALSSVMGPPTPGTGRTTTQRRAQALADLARIALDNAHTGSGAAVRPHLTVTVSWTELTALATTAGATPTQIAGIAGIGGIGSLGGVGTTSTTGPAPAPTGGTGRTGRAGGTGGTGRIGTSGGAVFTETGVLIPPTLLAKIACDSQVTRVIFGPDSQVLDVGRTKRTITGELRRAVIARDKHCTWPGCDQPPSRCEVHHATRHWAAGGETSVTNSALLCWHHHNHVDTTHITMTRHNSEWTFTDPHGNTITDTGPWQRDDSEGAWRRQ